MINKVFLIGRAGKDATVATTDRGSKVLKFTLATWVNVKDSSHESGWKTLTEWHNIVCWSDNADNIAANVKTGSMVVVDGSVRTRQYEDKNGETKYITEIVGNVKVLNPPKPKEEKPKDVPPPDKDYYIDPETGLPF